MGPRDCTHEHLHHVLSAINIHDVPQPSSLLPALDRKYKQYAESAAAESAAADSAAADPAAVTVTVAVVVANAVAVAVATSVLDRQCRILSINSYPSTVVVAAVAKSLLPRLLFFSSFSNMTAVPEQSLLV